jgi:hypothetical protein
MGNFPQVEINIFQCMKTLVLPHPPIEAKGLDLPTPFVSGNVKFILPWFM